MDDITGSIHSHNVDQILEQLGTYVDPVTRSALLKLLVIEENKLAKGREQLQNTERRISDGKARIARVAGIIDGLIEHGLMDRDQLSKALTVLTALREAQTLIERRYRLMTDAVLV
jgi:hypothetical protein